MKTAPKKSLAQRADYTHKHNAKVGRHGWLRLTPAYSLKIVDDILAGYDDASKINILDPFCGTGTTALCAAYHGQRAVTTDINPFLVWLSRVKTDLYEPLLIDELRRRGKSLVAQAMLADAARSPIPCMHNIDRWWDQGSLDFLCSLKGAIDVAYEEGTKEHSLLLIAFCRTLISLSNAAFNHQSMSFKSDKQSSMAFEPNLPEVFLKDLDFVLHGAGWNPVGRAQVFNSDARNLCPGQIGKFDCVITSPPYANRMSYIRELRPYMYWLGYLLNSRDAGEMDWKAIGGTWGVATSRLNEWVKPGEGFKSKLLEKASMYIGAEKNKNGPLLARYVLRYFDDMWSHFKSLTGVLNRGAEVCYIVGNSTFYGNLVAVEQIYAEMLSELGFTGVECIPIRKRNSKRELIEFNVRARWPVNAD